MPGVRQILGYKKEKAIDTELQTMFEGDEIQTVLNEGSLGLQKLQLGGEA